MSLESLNAPLVNDPTNISLDLTNEIQNIDEFPGFSQYEESNCLCCKKYKVNNISNFFLGHWEFSPLMPISVCLIILTTYFFAIFFINKQFSKSAEVFCDILLTFLVVIYIIPYFLIIIEGPGYFPFYFAGIKNNKIANIPPTVNGVNYSPHGIISNPDQHLYAISNEKPNRSIVARSGRRIIIRPDHLCGWTASWIGKKNMKFFIQFNIYGALYCFVYIILCVSTMFKAGAFYENMFRTIAITLFGLMAMFFFGWQVNNSYTTIDNMLKGQTYWEIWNKIDNNKFNHGKRKNIEDVFGDGANIFSYLCFTRPFKNISEEDLVRDYKNYYY